MRYNTAEYRTGKTHATTDGHSTLCMPWRKDATETHWMTDDVDCPVCAARLPYTDSDVAQAVESYRDMEDTEDDGWTPEPEVMMFSFGYGELWPDGEVIAFGRVVFTVDSDGVVS